MKHLFFTKYEKAKTKIKKKEERNLKSGNGYNKS